MLSMNEDACLRSIQGDIVGIARVNILEWVREKDLLLTSSNLFHMRKTYYYRDHYLDPSKCGVCELIIIASLLSGIPFYPLIISLVK